MLRTAPGPHTDLFTNSAPHTPGVCSHRHSPVQTHFHHWKRALVALQSRSLSSHTSETQYQLLWTLSVSRTQSHRILGLLTERRAPSLFPVYVSCSTHRHMALGRADCSSSCGWGTMRPPLTGCFHLLALMSSAGVNGWAHTSSILFLKNDLFILFEKSESQGGRERQRQRERARESESVFHQLVQSPNGCIYPVPI